MPNEAAGPPRLVRRTSYALGHDGRFGGGGQSACTGHRDHRGLRVGAENNPGSGGPCGVTVGPVSWLPDDFVHPVLVPLPGGGHHLRPIREADTPLDYPAVMGSRERLWSIFGPAWGWPAATMTYEADQADLLRHEKEIAAHQSFNYALFDAAETALLGCVYIDPPEKAGADGEISWWVVDELVGSEVEQALDALVPRWIAADWPFEQPRFIGRDISWSRWLALPAHADA